MKISVYSGSFDREIGFFDRINYFKALEDDYPVPGIKKNKYYKIVYIGEKEYKFLEVK